MLAGPEKIDSGEIIYNGEPLPIDELERRSLLGFFFKISIVPTSLQFRKLGAFSNKYYEYV